MSDYYDGDSFDDSFESGSESEGCDGLALEGQQVVMQPFRPEPDALAGPRVRELAVESGGTSKGGYLTFSDQDEHESSAQTSSKSMFSKSPKPKRRFKPSGFKVSGIRPNLGNIKDKLLSRLKKDCAVFGVSLETAVQRSVLGTDGVELPTVFRECLDYLEERGLEHEGVYRLPGVKSKIEDLKSRYDKGDVIDLSDCDPNVIASLLKQYLRELPEPTIPQRMLMRTEALPKLSPDQQFPILQEVMEEIPTQQKLLLSWLLVHMRHVTEHSSVNKMTLPNLIIVFSPTLQIPAPTLHILYNYCTELFGDIELTKYEVPKPIVELRRDSTAIISLSHVKSLQTEEEVTAELARLTGILEKIHDKITGKFDERDDYCWDLQRAITELRRKLKTIQKSQKAHSSGEEEFLKTLIIMEATLRAENEELSARKEELQSAIKREVELIEEFKKELKKYEPGSRSQPSPDEESGDEAELAKKVAALKWHGKEMELRNRNLIKSIMEEEQAILELKVKLKVHPLKHKLKLDE